MYDPTSVQQTFFLHPNDERSFYIDCTELLAGSEIDGPSLQASVADGSISVLECEAIGGGGVVKDGVTIAAGQGFRLKVGGMQSRTGARIRVDFDLDGESESLGVDVYFKCQKP